MRVLHIFNELKFSGAEIMYVDAAPIFQKEGCELTAMATGESIGEFQQFFEQAGFKILHKPFPNLKNYIDRVFFYSAFIKLLKKERFDVVHIHRSDAMWGISLCCRLAGKRTVYTFHNVFPTRKLTYIYHCLLRWSAKLLFNCRFQTISDSVHKHEFKLYHNNTTKVYNWYSNNRFYPASINEKERVRKELNIPNCALVVISVGGCSQIKRHTEIIKALPDLIKFKSKTIYLHLGKGCLEESEKQLAKELGVLENIRFYDNQTDVRKYLIASDVYIMPSKFEGISITTIEALGCCIPAVLYDVPGLRDFNSKGETSLLIPEDYKSIVDGVAFLINNPSTVEKLTSNGKKFVDAYFSMHKNALEIFKLYQ
jgi:glycosyltransferase involved in cell wall biosynthesis